MAFSARSDWYVLTASPTRQAGIVTALQFLPGLSCFPRRPVVLADRVPGRLLQCTQTGAGLVSLVMGLVVLTSTAVSRAGHPGVHLGRDRRRYRARRALWELVPHEDGERRGP